MQRIYEPESLLEGQMLVDMLASEGVEAHLLGQHLVGAVGELPACGLLGLVVAEPYAERARMLIAEYNAAQPVPGDEPESFQGVALLTRPLPVESFHVWTLCPVPLVARFCGVARLSR